MWEVIAQLLLFSVKPITGRKENYWTYWILLLPYGHDFTAYKERLYAHWLQTKPAFFRKESVWKPLRKAIIFTCNFVLFHCTTFKWGRWEERTNYKDDSWTTFTDTFTMNMTDYSCKWASGRKAYGNYKQTRRRTSNKKTKISVSA